MDPSAVARVLDGLARDAGQHVLLWRGEELGGNDVDVVVTPGGGAAVARALRQAGLVPSPQDPGRVLWRRLPDLDVVVDVLADHAWPAMYPRLDDVRRRAATGSLGLLVAAPVDRVLVHAAEAVAGRGWPRTAARLTTVLEGAEETPGQVLAAALRQDAALARIAQRAWRQDGATTPLPASLVVRAVLGSRRARSAARTRLLGEPLSLPSITAPVSRPRLVALSGMDGAGKSTASLALLDHFEQRGEPALVHWTRVGADLGPLVHLGRLARRLLRREQPVSSEGDLSGAVGSPSSGPARSGVLDAVWVVAVALMSVRAARQAGRLRGAGVHVVCDRWLLDALVDLRLRYGRHPAAEWVLRRGFPHPDVALLLRVEPADAAARKPGDQPVAVLESMAALYDALTPGSGVEVLDAGMPAGDLLALVLHRTSPGRRDPA